MAPAAAPNSNPSGIESWLRSVGIWWDTSLIRIQGGCSNCSGPALGIIAEQDIQENKLLCVIPRSAILSPRTTQLAAVLEAEKLGGGLALSIAVMYEASLGAASRWAGYLQSLPDREYLPIFWTEEQLGMLQGTALENCAEDDRRDTEEDYQTHVIPLMTGHPEAFPHPGLCSLQHFRVAASWVASRSFHVDSWHGDAMVPLADIFNHKASLVLLDDAWKVAEEMEAEHGPGGTHGNSSSSSSSKRRKGSKNSALDKHETAGAAGAVGIGSEVQGDELHGGGDGHEGVDGVDNSVQREVEDDNEDNVEVDSEVDSEDGDDDDDNEEEEEEEEDPQHGFAVGGMPLTAATAASGIVHKAASCWVRDGVNLRLEIGICSLGPPDNTDMAAAAAGSDRCDLGDHDHHDHHDGEHETGCSHKHKRQRTEHHDHQQQQQQQQQFPSKRLEIIAASPVAAGAEVHNTYGELSNAELVHKYGFCLSENPFDEVQLGPSWAWLLLEVGKLDRQEKFKQHTQWLQEHSDVLPTTPQHGLSEDAEDEDEEAEVAQPADPPAVTPGGRLPLATAAVIRLLGANTAQLMKWNSLEDVLDDMAQQSPAKEVPAAAAAAAEQEQDEGSAAAAAATGLSEHFEDVLLTSHDDSWWGHKGLEILAAGIEQRLMRYPAGGTAFPNNTSVEQQQQQQQQQQDKKEEKEQEAMVLKALQQLRHKNQGTLLDSDSLKHLTLEADEKALQSLRQQQKQQQQQGTGAAATGEHAAAVALQLRICEQRILWQALNAVAQVIGAA